MPHSASFPAKLIENLHACVTGWFGGAELKELASGGERPVPSWLFYWIRFGIPAAILVVGIWWLLANVFDTVTGV